MKTVQHWNERIPNLGSCVSEALLHGTCAGEWIVALSIRAIIRKETGLVRVVCRGISVVNITSVRQVGGLS